ncbi:MAG: hypothetical protein ACTSQB_06760 [Candidatus Heimdallarchaeota archaeon]
MGKSKEKKGEATIQELQSDEAPSEKKEGSFKKISRAIFSWSTISLMFSHHPHCETFDNHVFKIGKLHLCKGCTLSYPPAYAIPLIITFWAAARTFFLYTPLWMSNLWWFTIYTGILAFVTRYLGKKSSFVNDISKFIRGAFAGFLFGIMLAEAWYFKLIAGIALIGGMGYLSIKRGKDMQRTCDTCEYGSDFSSCPGWNDFSELFIQPETGSQQPDLSLTPNPTTPAQEEEKE